MMEKKTFPKGYEPPEPKLKEIDLLTISPKEYFDIMNIEDPANYEMKAVSGVGVHEDSRGKWVNEALDSCNKLVSKKALILGADVVVGVKYETSSSRDYYQVLASGIALVKDKKGE